MNLRQSFIQRLPHKYVDLIERNLDMSDYPDMLDTTHFMPIESELMQLFQWEESIEGYDFWNEVHLYLVGLTSELPEIPIYMGYRTSEIMYANSHIYVMNVSNTGVCIKYKSPIEEGWSSINRELEEKVLSFLN